ncbi:hypothetical protein AAVH_36227 [Aphelenchoides avenae]|nr:hypothetical protein AAVH_36227 [Aphelenchus avenae]
MQTDSPDDSLVREAIALLGPGAKDARLDDLTAWIRQLEELCGSQDAALAPASFRTDISGSCRSTFPECGKKQATTTQTTKLQTKDVKGYPSLPELHMEKVSSNKKNARGEAKLRLSVDGGPVLVMLTITDFDGATHTLRAVTADENDLIPIKHPGTRIEATVIPFAPDELLERLRHVEEKIQAQRIQPVQPSASTEQKASVDEQKASDRRQG